MITIEVFIFGKNDKNSESAHLISSFLPNMTNEIGLFCNPGFWLGASIPRCLYHSNSHNLSTLALNPYLAINAIKCLKISLYFHPHDFFLNLFCKIWSFRRSFLIIYLRASIFDKLYFLLNQVRFRIMSLDPLNFSM